MGWVREERGGSYRSYHFCNVFWGKFWNLEEGDGEEFGFMRRRNKEKWVWVVSSIKEEKRRLKEFQ